MDSLRLVEKGPAAVNATDLAKVVGKGHCALSSSSGNVKGKVKVVVLRAAIGHDLSKKGLWVSWP